MLNYSKGLDCHVAWKGLILPSPETFPQTCNLYCPGSLECSCSLFNPSTLTSAAEPFSSCLSSPWSDKPALWDPDRNAHMKDW